MKKTILLTCLLLIAGFSFAQQKKAWKEMQEFHVVMGKTFHPSEENNLQPLRNHSAELVEKAKAWKNAVVPDGYNGEAVKPALKKLVKKTVAINKAVKKQRPDAELKKMITEAHDIFHEITEKCRPGEEDKH